MKKVFDIRGQVCPSALLVTLREINGIYRELQQGECILQVLTDSRKATMTIPSAATNMGFKVDVIPEEDYYQIVIRTDGSDDSEG